MIQKIHIEDEAAAFNYCYDFTLGVVDVIITHITDSYGSNRGYNHLYNINHVDSWNSAYISQSCIDIVKNQILNSPQIKENFTRSILQRIEEEKDSIYARSSLLESYRRPTIGLINKHLQHEGLIDF